jgi:hypothetical protein
MADYLESIFNELYLNLKIVTVDDDLFGQLHLLVLDKRRLIFKRPNSYARFDIGGMKSNICNSFACNFVDLPISLPLLNIEVGTFVLQLLQ